jgi:hypothetical protein
MTEVPVRGRAARPCDRLLNRASTSSRFRGHVLAWMGSPGAATDTAGWVNTEAEPTYLEVDGA